MDKIRQFKYSGKYKGTARVRYEGNTFNPRAVVYGVEITLNMVLTDPATERLELMSPEVKPAPSWGVSTNKETSYDSQRVAREVKSLRP